MTWYHEDITGADLSGSSGDTNRTYSLANANAQLAGMQIIVDGSPFQNNEKFTLAGNAITFIPAVFDDQPISIDYETEEVEVPDCC